MNTQTNRLIRTLVCLLITSVCFHFPVAAQSSLSLGPKAGASFSGFRGDDAGKISLRKGVAGGIFLNFAPAPFFAIQPEVMFQQRGAVNENKNFNFREDVKIGYLNVPVLFKLRLPIDKTFFPHVYAGPQFSYALKSDYTVTSLDAGVFDRDFSLKNADVGGVFGFGLDIESNHLFFTTDFRYGLGALNIGKNGEARLKNKDLAILLGIGYRF